MVINDNHFIMIMSSLEDKINSLVKIGMYEFAMEHFTTWKEINEQNRAKGKEYYNATKEIELMSLLRIKSR